MAKTSTWPNVFLAALLSAAPAAAQVGDEPPIIVDALKLAQGTLTITPQEASGEGAAARRVPGFEMRGFEGDVKREGETEKLVALGFEPQPKPGQPAPRRIQVVLYNVSDDLIAITETTPPCCGEHMPFKTGLELPIELDWQEKAIILEAETEWFFTARTLSMSFQVEGSTKHTFKIDARRP